MEGNTTPGWGGRNKGCKGLAYSPRLWLIAHTPQSNCNGRSKELHSSKLRSQKNVTPSQGARLQGATDYQLGSPLEGDHPHMMLCPPSATFLLTTGRISQVVHSTPTQVAGKWNVSSEHAHHKF
eukprot:1158069-Pelagomonas_calceolata.AAC.1